MDNCYIELIKKFSNDVRFKNTNLSFTVNRRKYYKEGKELEVKILRVVVEMETDEVPFLRTCGFRVNYIVEDNLTEVVTNSGYLKKQYEGLDYKKISLFIYESLSGLIRKDLSIRKVL